MDDQAILNIVRIGLTQLMDNLGNLNIDANGNGQGRRLPNYNMYRNEFIAAMNAVRIISERHGFNIEWGDELERAFGVVHGEPLAHTFAYIRSAIHKIDVMPIINQAELRQLNRYIENAMEAMPNF